MEEPRRRRSLEEWLDILAEKVPPLRTFTVRDPGVGKFEPQVLDDFTALRTLIDTYFRVDFEGVARVPREGGVLMVGNHGRSGLDAFIFTAVAMDKLGRPVRALADRRFFRVPGIRDWLAACGAVPGNRENAVRLLKAGFPVVVYPGGSREVMKQADEAYQLMWGDRTGFVAVALEAGVPIVPVAGIGVEELYRDMPGWDVVEQTRIMRLIDSVLRPHLGPPPPFLTGVGPLPSPAKLTFKIGKPIPTDGVNAADHAEVLAMQRKVKAEVEKLLEGGLAERQRADKRA